MRKIISTNAALIIGFVLIALAVLSFYAYGETQKACAQVKECTQAAPAQTQMLWDVLSHPLSVSTAE